jgi:hypothetical protein
MNTPIAAKPVGGSLTRFVRSVRTWLLTKNGQVVVGIAMVNRATGEVSTRRARFKIVPMFAWYDCWLGMFWDNKQKLLYVFPVPMLGFKVGYQ